MLAMTVSRRKRLELPRQKCPSTEVVERIYPYLLELERELALLVAEGGGDGQLAVAEGESLGGHHLVCKRGMK